MSLIFDPVKHEYFFAGRKVPGVTSILSPLTNFDAVPPAILQAASEFGKAVHLACELDDLGILDDSELDAALVPYLKGWRKFVRDTDATWDDIERPCYHPLMRYAGTPDRIGRVNGLLTVVDIKSTAQLYASVGPQLSAYAHASANSTAVRLAVQLRADATYVAKAYQDPGDWPVFCSLLTLKNWCQKNSITPNLEKHK